MLLTSGRIYTLDAANAVVEERIKDIVPVLTMVGGEVVFSREG